MMLELMIAIPIATAILVFFSRSRRQMEIISTAGIVSLFAVACYMVYDVITYGNIEYSVWYMDSLSAYMLFIIAFIGLMAGLYSVPYIGHEVKEKELSVDRAKYYYVLFHIFMFTMLMVVISNNLGIMWIAIEATTLVSAFLVGFTENDMAVEAAWKYLIICSVGITLALFGTILAYASSIAALGESSDALNWSTMMASAANLDPTLLKISFILIMVGYGTKVGLAPMHTWLPDAHSQAPTPVSALLSGVLLNCAMYGILRYHLIVSVTVPGFSSTLLLIFGLVSMARGGGLHHRGPGLQEASGLLVHRAHGHHRLRVRHRRVPGHLRGAAAHAEPRPHEVPAVPGRRQSAAEVQDPGHRRCAGRIHAHADDRGAVHRRGAGDHGVPAIQHIPVGGHDTDRRSFRLQLSRGRASTSCCSR